ncbi:MAG TPA: hypothetical protein VN948_09115 [Terriglobales bacterium]|nr:hypothetical protein [Terriglobales bacterium]
MACLKSYVVLFEIDETWVDQRSVAELNNCIVDYVDTLEGASFKFENPNVKKYLRLRFFVQRLISRILDLKSLIASDEALLFL